MLRNIVFSSIKKIYTLLPPDYRKRSGKMMMLLFVNSFLELFGLAAFVPLFLILLQKNIINENAYLNWLYNFGNFASENVFVLFIAGTIFIMVLLKNLFSLAILKSQANFSLSLYRFYTLELYRSYKEKGYTFFKETNSNIILQNLNVVTQRYANNLILPIFNFLNELIIILLILVSLIIYDWKVIILITFSVLPIFLFLYRYLNRLSVKVETKTNNIQPIVTEKIFQSVYGYTDIELTNTYKNFRKKMTLLLNELVDLSINRTIYAHIPLKFMETIMVMTVFIITVYGLFFLNDISKSASVLGLYALAAYRILPSINRMILALISIKSYQYTFEVIEEIDCREGRETVDLPLKFEKSINFDNVTFYHPGSINKILKNANFSVQKGDAIGIIGPSGSGKTTLMNLMLGFLTPTEGSISVDGIIISKNRMKEWRKKIGYVQQEVYIINATIAENIAFGLELHEINRHRLDSAIKKASLTDFVQSLPNKAFTEIGERGSNLSGGQRQRLGIARAIYSGASILFFDEATSALDMNTEKEITEAIKLLSKENFTVVIIAHRLSTLVFCNRILEISHGRVKYNANISNTVQ